LTFFFEQSLEAITFAALSLSNTSNLNLDNDDEGGNTSKDISLPISESVIPESFDCSTESHPRDLLTPPAEVEYVGKREEPNVDALSLSDQREAISQAYKVSNRFGLMVRSF
jgi:hypothetical protein